MANRLYKVLVPSIIHNAQYGFLGKRDILGNILNVQIGIDYVKESKLVQLTNPHYLCLTFLNNILNVQMGIDYIAVWFVVTVDIQLGWTSLM